MICSFIPQVGPSAHQLPGTQLGVRDKVVSKGDMSSCLQEFTLRRGRGTGWQVREGEGSTGAYGLGGSDPPGGAVSLGDASGRLQCC